MITWRCLSCGAVYADPQPDGSRAYHTCPVDRVLEDGTRVPIEDPRDENHPRGVVIETTATGAILEVWLEGQLLGTDEGAIPIKRAGKGRVRVEP